MQTAVSLSLPLDEAAALTKMYTPLQIREVLAPKVARFVEVVGGRRAGKTSLLFNIAKNNPKPFVCMLVEMLWHASVDATEAFPVQVTSPSSGSGTVRSAPTTAAVHTAA